MTEATGQVPTPTVRGTRSIAILLPGSADDGSYFSDVLPSRMCAEARLLGHQAVLVRVPHHGDDPERRETQIAELERFLDERAIDFVVAERRFESAPLHARRLREPQLRVLMIAQGEMPPSLDGIDFILGEHAGRLALSRESIAPLDQLLDAWVGLLEALRPGGDPRLVAGLAVVEKGRLVGRRPFDPARGRRPFRATVEQLTLGGGVTGTIRRRTLNGTHGCPYSADALANPHYAGIVPPEGLLFARSGCAFCPMGGDYIAGTDESIVADLVEQARFWAEHDPAVEEFVLSDQHPIRYLAPLMAAVRAAGMRPFRWLFAARADAFVRGRAELESALREAAVAGQRLEVYLTGFESFSAAELHRYNKGITVADQLGAVDAMRALRKAHPTAFDYGRARGHSLILWNPWTDLDDLDASIATVREHGLGDLLRDLGRNRLRLYPNLPIYHAAARDGALDGRWDVGEGTARRHGYGSEHSWKFLHERTRLAYALAEALRAHFGVEGEVAQLAAVTAYVRSDAPVDQDVGETVRGVVAGLLRLEAALADVGGLPSPVPAETRRAAVVAFAGGCNNGCATCANRDVWLDDDFDSVSARIDVARSTGRDLVLAGREPTVHPRIGSLLHRAAGSDGRGVGVVTNGRRFAYDRFTAACVGAGLKAASVKCFGHESGVADAHARVEGAHAQALEGISRLVAAGVEVEVRLVLHRDALPGIDRAVDVVAARGVRRVRIETAIDAVGLASLSAGAEAVARIAERAAASGLSLRSSPVGQAVLEYLPVASS